MVFCVAVFKSIHARQRDTKAKRDSEQSKSEIPRREIQITNIRDATGTVPSGSSAGSMFERVGKDAVGFRRPGVASAASAGGAEAVLTGDFCCEGDALEAACSMP